jgi:glycosyltransferase involved in cell wall biosynthesis
MSKNEKNKPTILITTSTFPRSETDTIPRFILDLAISLKDQWNIIVLAPHQKGTKSEQTISGIKVYRYRYMISPLETLVGEGGIYPKVKKNWLYVFVVPFFLVFQLIATIRISKREQVDLIHAHWLFPQGFIAFWAYLVTKVPYGVSSHGSEVNQLTFWLFRWAHNLALSQARFVTTAGLELALKVERYGYQEAQVIPMGINQGFFEVKRANVDLNSIISVGRLDKQKGFQDVIRALPSLPEHHYIIIGEGSDRTFFEELAKKYGVKDRVHFVGSKTPEEIMQFYQTSGLFILPSRTEGFGLSVVEAMAAGIPVITSNIEVLSMHTERGDGISIDTQDSSQLQSAILQISKVDTQKAKEYAKVYSWESVGHKFSTLYNNTLNT